MHGVTLNCLYPSPFFAATPPCFSHFSVLPSHPTLSLPTISSRLLPLSKCLRRPFSPLLHSREIHVLPTHAKPLGLRRGWFIRTLLRPPDKWRLQFPLRTYHISLRDTVLRTADFRVQNVFCLVFC